MLVDTDSDLFVFRISEVVSIAFVGYSIIN